MQNYSGKGKERTTSFPGSLLQMEAEKRDPGNEVEERKGTLFKCLVVLSLKHLLGTL